MSPQFMLAPRNRGGVGYPPTSDERERITTMTAATKTCPGFAPDGIAPHAEPADLEHFNSNKGGKDGLSTRCRVCGNLYGKAWAAAKKRGEAFSVKGVRADVRQEQLAEQAEAAQAITHPDGTPVFTATAEQRAEREGWTTETIDGVVYALPTNGSAETPEGQAALAAIHEATTAARRKRDRERKRDERAAAKARAAQA